MSFETNSTSSSWEEQNLAIIEADQEPETKNSGESIFGTIFEIAEMDSENILSVLHLNFSLPRSEKLNTFCQALLLLQGELFSRFLFLPQHLEIFLPSSLRHFKPLDRVIACHTFI